MKIFRIPESEEGGGILTFFPSKGRARYGWEGGGGGELNRGFTVYSFISDSWGAGTDAWGPDRDDVSNLP